MSAGTSNYVHLPEGRLKYEVAGEGPPLVFVHAVPFDSSMWDEQWSAFSRDHTVIRYDLLGFGHSDPLTALVSHRRQLYQLLDHLGIGRATLVGCSFGGEIVLDTALERADLVAALVVVSAVPSGFEMQGEPPQELLALFGAVEQGDDELASELAMRVWIDGPFRQPEEVAPAVRRHAAAMARRSLAKGSVGLAFAPSSGVLDPPAAQRLAQVGVPTLIIAGVLDNPELLRAANMMAAAIPGAEQVSLADAAHLPNMEQPEAFNQTVRHFLDSRV